MFRDKRMNFVTRRTRTADAGMAVRGWIYAARRVIISVSIFLLLVFALNLIVKYFFEAYDIKKIAVKVTPFAKPKFFVIKDNFYVLYSNGTTKIVDSNIDREALPVLTGIMLNEKREKYKKVMKQVMSIKPDYFREISEINVRDPENILLITIDSKKVLVGGTITEEKMSNLYTVMEKADRRYDVIDIRFKDRVIIK